MTKLTVRIPDPVATALRERSREQGRSLNDTVVRTLAAAFDLDVEGDGWMAFGPLVEDPPVERFDPEWAASTRDEVGRALSGLDADLDWARGE